MNTVITGRSGRCISFGPFELYPDAGELRKFDVPVRNARPQCIAFLAALLEDPGKLIPKALLEKRLWPGEIARENRLNVVASAAWRLLHDTDRAARKYFVSQGREGYRFVHPISRFESETQHARRHEAERRYREGLLKLEKRYEKPLLESLSHFKEAIELNPSFASAWVGLSVANIMLGLHCVEAPGDAFPKAQAAAEEALRIEPILVKASVCLAWVALCYERNWKKAEQILRHALRKDGRDPFGHNALALLNVAKGRLDATVSSLARARSLNAISPPLNGLLCHCLYLARRFQDAAMMGARAARSDPHSPLIHNALALALLQLGEAERALFHVTKARELSDESTVYMGFWAYVSGMLGRQRDTEEVLSKLLSSSKDRYVPAYFVAIAHLGLGEHAACLKWLNKSCNERSHWVLFLNSDPIFDPIRNKKEFQRIARAVGLSKRGGQMSLSS